MPKANKIETPSLNGILKRKTHSMQPWEVQHQPDHSEIEAYVEISGEIEVIAVTKGINHVAIAEFIVALANEHNQKPKYEINNNHYSSRR